MQDYKSKRHLQYQRRLIGNGHQKENFRLPESRVPEYRLAALHLMSNSSSGSMPLPSKRLDENETGAVPLAYVEVR